MTKQNALFVNFSHLWLLKKPIQYQEILEGARQCLSDLNLRSQAKILKENPAGFGV